MYEVDKLGYQSVEGLSSEEAQTSEDQEQLYDTPGLSPVLVRLWSDQDLARADIDQAVEDGLIDDEKAEVLYYCFSELDAEITEKAGSGQLSRPNYN